MLTLRLFSAGDTTYVTLGPVQRFQLDGSKLTPGLAPEKEIIHRQGQWKSRGRSFTNLESDVPVLLFVGQSAEPLGRFQKLSMVDGSLWHEKDAGKVLLGRLDEKEETWHFPRQSVTSRTISFEACREEVVEG
jgi:hypothetical protein